LSGDHHDLTAMMGLVRHEVGQHMSDVERQVAPDIFLRRRKHTGGGEPKSSNATIPRLLRFNSSSVIVVLFSEIWRDMFDGFADDFKAPRASSSQHVICNECVEVDAACSFQ
jgi:hypothetical protein